MSTDLAARVVFLEAENERIFREAQVATDTIFAEYQLSQILATHEAPEALAGAVLDELLHVCGAELGALWTVSARSGALEATAARGTDGSIPDLGEMLGAEPTDAEGRQWSIVRLEDGGRLVGLLGLATPAGRPMPDSQRRLVELVRHELAVAIRSAQLRAALERERAELSAVIDGASDAIVVVDEERRMTRINPAAARLLGARPDELRGLRCDEALGCAAIGSPPQPCGGRCPFERTIRTGDPLHGEERFIGVGDDAVALVGSYTLASRNDTGAVAVAIYRDTTELARLAELRRGFLATVSHELRTPLALVKGYVETLLHLDPEPATARGYLRRIDETTDRLTHLVSQILDVTLLAAGQLILDPEAIDVGALLGAARDDLRVGHPELRVDMQIEADLPRVTADAGRLRQVIDNLLANAAKYSDPNARVIASAAADGEELMIRIEDDGIGIPTDERELVFEQFHRGRNVRESSLPGSGLGLAISRSLVEAQGGSLTIDPHHRPGTAIIVRLPMRRTGRPLVDLPPTAGLAR